VHALTKKPSHSTRLVRRYRADLTVPSALCRSRNLGRNRTTHHYARRTNARRHSPSTRCRSVSREVVPATAPAAHRPAPFRCRHSRLPTGSRLYRARLSLLLRTPCHPIAKPRCVSKPWRGRSRYQAKREKAKGSPQKGALAAS
jgi:hypothetical protein